MVFSICSLSPAVCVFTGAFLQVKELEVAWGLRASNCQNRTLDSGF